MALNGANGFRWVSGALAWFLMPTFAQEPVLNRELMEYLAGDPVVNEGSDGVLTQLPEDSSALIEEGRERYGVHCASCHGDQLQGQLNWKIPGDTGLLPAPPHDETGHTWHHADDQLFEVVKYGPAIAMGDADYRSIMPVFDEVLDDSEIVSILVFIRSTWSEEHRLWQQGANDAQSGKLWWQDPQD